MISPLWQNNRVKIFQVLSGRSNAWLVLAEDKIILVDTGKAAGWNRLVRNIGLAGKEIHQLDYLFLTHTHFDHCQSAARIRNESGCKIMVSKNAISSALNGYTTLPQGTFFTTRLIARLGRKIGKRRFGYGPFEPDITIDKDCTLGLPASDIRIITTPGHSQDCISLIINNELAIVGDALFGVFPILESAVLSCPSSSLSSTISLGSRRHSK